MIKVKVGELKAKLSAYLRRVRQGESVVVMNRDIPVARIVPETDRPNALAVREPRGKHLRPRDVPLPRLPKISTDVVKLLLDDRNSGR